MINRKLITLFLIFLCTNIYAYNFTIKGKIFNEQTSKPVPNHIIKIINENNVFDTIQLITDELGFYQTKIKIKEGEYNIFEIMTWGYKETVWFKYSEIIKSYDGIFSHNFQIILTENYPIKTFTTQGYILDIYEFTPFKNHPVNLFPNVKDTINKVTVYTDNNGFYNYTFAFPYLYHSKLLINTKGNCENRWQNYNNSVNIYNGIYTKNLYICHDPFWYLKDFIIQGYIYDTLTSEPIPNHPVFIISRNTYNDNSKIQTDENGFYSDTNKINILKPNTNIFDIRTYSYCWNNSVTYYNNTITGYNGSYSKEFYICQIDTIDDTCSSTFFYCIDNDSRKVSFFSVSNSNPVEISWNLGDGSYASGSYCTHTYEAEGAYTVQLEVISETGCTSVDEKRIVIGNGVSLSGNITASGVNIPTGHVFAYKYDDNKSNYQFLNLTSIDEGSFCFNKIILGNYLLYAVPTFDINENYFPKYIPTYYDNNHNWENSTPINLSESQENINIDLIKYDEIYYGNGRIHGKVNFERRTTIQIQQIIVILYNEYDQPINFTPIDEFDEFEFDKLPYGDYKIQIEYPGKNSKPCFITLSEEKPTSPFILFTIGIDNIDFDVIDIKEVPQQDFDFSIFPNPFVNSINIAFDGEYNNFINICLTNMYGQKVYERRIETNEQKHLNQDLSNLPAGVYMFNANIDNTNFYSKKLIKE